MTAHAAPDGVSRCRTLRTLCGTECGFATQPSDQGRYVGGCIMHSPIEFASGSRRFIVCVNPAIIVGNKRWKLGECYSAHRCHAICQLMNAALRSIHAQFGCFSCQQFFMVRSMFGLENRVVFRPAEMVVLCPGTTLNITHNHKESIWNRHLWFEFSGRKATTISKPKMAAMFSELVAHTGPDDGLHHTA